MVDRSRYLLETVQDKTHSMPVSVLAADMSFDRFHTCRARFSFVRHYLHCYLRQPKIGHFAQ